jgi:hypothetical protein
MDSTAIIALNGFVGLGGMKMLPKTKLIGIITLAFLLILFALPSAVMAEGNPGTGGDNSPGSEVQNLEPSDDSFISDSLAVPGEYFQFELGDTTEGDIPENERGFDYCKLGTGYDGSCNVTGERYVFGPGMNIVLGAKYSWVWSDFWVGYGFYRPDGSIYSENKKQKKVDVPWYGWSSYRRVYYYYPMPSSMQSVEGTWKAVWYHNGSGKPPLYFTVMYNLTDHTMCGNIISGAPNDTTHTFGINHTAAYSWLKFTDYAMKYSYDIRFDWWGPEGYYKTTYYDITNPSNYHNSVTAWSSINISGAYPSTYPGDWHVDVYVKDYTGNYEHKYTEYFTITNPCEISPTSLAFGEANIDGGYLDQDFTISNVDPASPIDGTVSLSCPDFQLLTDPGYFLDVGESKTFTVRFQPLTMGSKSCTINTGSLCSSIECTGTGIATGPVCQVTPRNLNFGMVALDTVKQLTFTIKNVGIGTLTGDVSFSGEHECFSFVSGDGSYSLDSAQTRTVTVEFEPLLDQEYSCDIDLGSSACGTVSCQGEGWYGGILTEKEVGGLMFYANSIIPTANGYHLTGDVNIAHVLYFSGDMEIDLGELAVTGSGLVTIPEVPLLDDVTIYEGAINFSLTGTNLIEFFDLGQYTGFELGGFVFQLDNLTFLSDGVMIGGSIEFPETIGGGVYIDDLSITKSDGLEIIGTIELPDMEINGLGLKNMYVEFNTVDDIFGGGLTVETPMVTVGGELQFIQGALNKIFFEIETSPGIAIDATGLFLSGGAGGLDHISDPEPLLIRLTIDITGGPEIAGMAVVKLNDVGVEIQFPLYLKAMGSLEVFNFPILYTEVMYQNKCLKFSASYDIPPKPIDLLSGQIGASLSGFKFSGNYDASLHTPSDLPWWLSWAENRQIGYVTADVNNEYFRGMCGITLHLLWWDIRFSLAFKVSFGAPSFPWFHFALGTNYDNLTQIFKRYLGDDCIVTYAVGEGCERALFIVKSESGPLPDFYLINPAGDTLDENTLPFADFSAEGYAFYIVDDPSPGNWDIYVIEGSARQFEAYVKGPNIRPTIHIISPAIKGDENLIAWEADDIDDDAEIYFFYDTDNDGFNGIPVNAQSIREDSRIEQLIWDNTDVEPGEYYIYAVIEDSLNAPTRIYSRGTIVVDDPSLPDAPTGFTASVQDSTVVFGWNAVPGFSAYVVFYQDTSCAVCVPMPFAVNDTSQYVESVLYGLPFGHIYSFQVAAATSMGKTGDLSEPVILELYCEMINNCPDITSVNPPLAVLEGQLYEYALSAIDLDGDEVVFELAVNPDGMQLVGNTINWTPDSTQVGVSHVKVSASDNQGGMDSLEFNIHVFDVLSTIPQLYLNKNIYRGLECTGYITMDYFDINASSSQVDTAVVQLQSDSDPTGIQVKCMETGVFSNTYVGQFSFSPNFSYEHDIKPGLMITSGDSLSISYQVPGDPEVYSDEAVWFDYPLDCDDLVLSVAPDKWSQNWWHSPMYDCSYPIFDMTVKPADLGGVLLSNMECKSLRVNNMIAPEKVTTYPLGQQVPDAFADSAVLQFEVMLVLHTLEPDTPGTYTLNLTGHSKDGVPFCAQAEVMLVEGEPPAHSFNDKVVPETYSLDQNYPNPFNASTQISFSLPEPAHVKLEIFNVSGQIITTLKDDELEAGTYNVFWNGKDKDGNEVAGGIYFYRLKTANFIETKKMLLLK